MKKIGMVLGILVSATTMFAANTKGEKASFEIDTKASKVYWNAKKVTGEHAGYVAVGSGTVMVENNLVIGAQINMDMSSIVCTDLTDAEWNKKLVGHLKSEDFFSVEKYPAANFKISSMEQAGNREFNVKGNLTIKGITNEISFPVKVTLADEKVHAMGTAKIDRTMWNIKYGSGKFFEGLGDKMIYDEFEITFDITAKVNNIELSAK